VDPVPVQPDDVGGWIAGERGLGQLLDRLVLFGGTSTQEVDRASPPVLDAAEVLDGELGVAHRVPEHEVLVEDVEGGPALRHCNQGLVGIRFVQFPSDVIELVGLPPGVGVSEDPHRGIVLLEPFEVPVQVGIPEVVVEDGNGEVDVRILLDLVAVVLADADCEPEFVGVRRERMAVQEPDVVRLLCLFNRLDSAVHLTI